MWLQERAVGLSFTRTVKRYLPGAAPSLTVTERFESVPPQRTVALPFELDAVGFVSAINDEKLVAVVIRFAPFVPP